MPTRDEQALCQILLRDGHIHEEQVGEAFELQNIRPKPVSQLLTDLGYVEEDHLLEALSEQYGIPFDPNVREKMDPALTTKAPIGFIREYRMVPYKKNGAAYHVALTDPRNLLPLDDLRLLLDAPVEPVLCREADIQQVIDTYFDQQGEKAADMIDDIVLADGQEDASEGIEALDQGRDLLDLANEAPIIKLINLLISGAVRERASDIHIEPYEKEVQVRYRIDGVLYDKHSVPKAQQAAVISRIKIMARMNIAEHRLPQDSRIKIHLSGKDIDIRVSVVPTAHGERVVMRILEKGAFLFGLEELGMFEDDYRLVDKLIQSSHGIILVTGPTGSGKSTTLYAVLQRVNSRDKNIITVEDPIEYQMDGIGQIQVHEKIGLTFAAGLRSILRQDPDIILIGEIRDHDTAEMAVQASLTGHLVFATLHTNDSAGAVTRLVNMGIEPFLVSSSTIAIMAQRLVRRICPHCAEPYEPTEESIRELGVNPDKVKGQPVYFGKGCSKCQDRGYFGRTGIFELMTLTPRLQEMTLEGADSNAIKREAIKEGMRTLRADGAAKVFRGQSTIEEVLRVTRDDMLEEVMD